MISELNVGHAYYWAAHASETSRASRTSACLGADFELATTDEGKSAYRVANGSYEGGPWDSVGRARPAELQPGMDVE